jgi:hypothetical protein
LIYVCIAETPASISNEEFATRWEHFQGRLQGIEVGPTLHNSAEVNAELLATPNEVVEVVDGDSAVAASTNSPREPEAAGAASTVSAKPPPSSPCLLLCPQPASKADLADPTKKQEHMSLRLLMLTTLLSYGKVSF